jgi:hypothetical protein
MKKSKILFNPYELDKISNSNVLKDKEKINFLRHIVYLTKLERTELLTYL